MAGWPVGPSSRGGPYHSFAPRTRLSPLAGRLPERRGIPRSRPNLAQSQTDVERVVSRVVARTEGVRSAGARAHFRFVDLFAGIGGVRLAFESIGGECVMTSEWDPYARRTYEANFPSENHRFEGDITKVDAADIPDHDVLLAGFPCQPFSIAGVSKKNALGRPHGFADLTQGTLFFDVVRILQEKRPPAFMLENVRNLKSHDGGRTFAVIMKVLEKDLGYHVRERVIEATPWRPQTRRRIFIVGFDNCSDFTLDDLPIPETRPTMDSVLHPEDGSEERELPYTHGHLALVDPKYTLTPRLWEYLQGYKEKHRAAGHGFGFGLVGRDDVARTLSARYYKDGSEILINRGVRARPRRLTPREAARLMGFPNSFQIPVSDSQAYKQFGNSVVVPLVTAVARHMSPHIEGSCISDDQLGGSA